MSLHAECADCAHSDHRFPVWDDPALEDVFNTINDRSSGSSAGSGNLTRGAIGIVCGVVAALLVSAVSWWWWRRRSRGVSWWKFWRIRNRTRADPLPPPYSWNDLQVFSEEHHPKTQERASSIHPSGAGSSRSPFQDAATDRNGHNNSGIHFPNLSVSQTSSHVWVETELPDHGDHGDRSSLLMSRQTTGLSQLVGRQG